MFLDRNMYRHTILIQQACGKSYFHEFFGYCIILTGVSAVYPSLADINRVNKIIETPLSS